MRRGLTDSGNFVQLQSNPPCRATGFEYHIQHDARPFHSGDTKVLPLLLELHSHSLTNTALSNKMCFFFSDMLNVIREDDQIISRSIKPQPRLSLRLNECEIRPVTIRCSTRPRPLAHTGLHRISKYPGESAFDDIAPQRRPLPERIEGRLYPNCRDPCGRSSSWSMS